MNNLNSLGSRVKFSREQLKLSQIELSQKAHDKNIELSKWALSRLETDVRGVTQLELECLAEILNVHAAWLLMGNLPADSAKTYTEYVTGMESAILASYRQNNFTNLMFLLGIKAGDSLQE